MNNNLSDVAADYTATTLNITPQGVVTQIGRKNQKVYTMKDGKLPTVDYSTGASTSDLEFYADIGWNILSASNASTILDFYLDTAKGCGQLRSFQLTYDEKTYTVRFASDPTRIFNVNNPKNNQSLGILKFRVLGNTP